MNIGKFQIDVLDTGIFGLDGGAMFGVVPKALWAIAYNPGDELNRIPLAARPLLIRTTDKIILVDTGNGNKMSDTFAERYGIDREKSSLELALKPFNLKPEKITDVILTHLHFDHAGGAAVIKNGEIVPTFPNAKYYVQKEHLMWAESPTDKDKASFVKNNYQSLVQNGLVETLDGPGELFPGITVMPVNGHTKAMQIVKISDGGQTLLYCADLSPTSAHVNIPFIMGYDNNPLTVIEEKKKYFAEAYEDKWILCFEHDAFVQAAYVNNTNKGFSAGEKVVITS
ncbi:MAG: MBL fold metallo-hydrolase [FCB group bacterium]|jgi:glyoxylase-like metal-dependent hydrolase (beta-lactamase superfamily II)